MLTLTSWSLLNLTALYSYGCWPTSSPTSEWPTVAEGEVMSLNCSLYAAAVASEEFVVVLGGAAPSCVASVRGTFDVSSCTRRIGGWVLDVDHDSIWVVDCGLTDSPDGKAAYRIQVPFKDGCHYTPKEMWRRTQRFAVDNIRSNEVVYGVMWSTLYGFHIFSALSPRAKPLEATMELMGTATMLAAVVVLTPLQWFWWSLIAVVTVASIALLTAATQLISKGRFCGHFIVPTRKHGMDLPLAFYRAVVITSLLAMITYIA